MKFIKSIELLSFIFNNKSGHFVDDRLSNITGLLQECRLGFVYLEGYYMPPIGQVFEKFKPATADFSIIRLHGGGRQEMELESGAVWNRAIAAKPEGLRAVVKIVRANARRRVLTLLNINNHYEGSAPLTIQRFLEALKIEDQHRD
jgi:uncharacterized protein YecE (DUF72 family)